MLGAWALAPLGLSELEAMHAKFLAATAGQLMYQVLRNQYMGKDAGFEGCIPWLTRTGEQSSVRVNHKMMATGSGADDEGLLCLGVRLVG